MANPPSSVVIKSPNDLPPFSCGYMNENDVTYEHDFIVNINQVTYTYCLELAFTGYKRGECVGIKSLMPGQKLTQNQSASYSQIVFDETGKQVAMTDSSSAETELIDAISINLSNLANSSNSSSTNWNVSASAGLDLGMFGSYGASGGGGGTDTHSDFTETFASCVTNSASKVKHKKASSNMSAFNSLHTTTTTNTTSSDSVDIIENLSKNKIVVYYFYTMYKVYQSRLYIKRAKTNWVMQSVVNMTPAIKRNIAVLDVPVAKVPVAPKVPVDPKVPVIPVIPVIAPITLSKDILADDAPMATGDAVLDRSPITDTYTAITTENQKNDALAKANAENTIIQLRRNSVLPKTLLLPIDGFHIAGENSKNTIAYNL